MTVTRRKRLRIVEALGKEFIDVKTTADIKKCVSMAMDKPGSEKASGIIGIICCNSNPKSIGIDKSEVSPDKSYEWITVIDRNLPIYNMESKDVCVIYIHDNKKVYIKPFFGMAKGIILARVICLLEKARIKYELLEYDISSVIPYMSERDRSIKNILADYTKTLYAPITSTIGINDFMNNYTPIDRFSSVIAFWLEKPIIERIKRSQEMEYMLHNTPEEYLPRA